MITENAIVTDNQRAKQKLNRMYLNQIGASETKSIMDWLSFTSYPFQVLSAMGSSFGFYYDLIDLGMIVAIIIAVLFGVAIEIIKHVSVKGFFNNSDTIMKTIYFGLGVIMLVVAVNYHIKSMNNYKGTIVHDELKEQVMFEREQMRANNKHIESSIATNAELAKVLNNKTNKDDLQASNGIQSNIELMGILGKMGVSSTATNALLSSSKSLAETRGNTLMYLLITLECFALLGIISKLNLSRVTNKNVKSIATTKERLDDFESTVAMTTETALIDNSIARVQGMINNTPTLPTQTVTNQPNKPQIGFNPNMGSNAYKSDYHTQNAFKTNIPNYLPATSGSNDGFSECHTQPSHSTKREEEQKITDKGNNEVLDLLKFDAKEQDIIKIMFENGSVKEGDRLLTKRLVKRELEGNRLLTKRDIDNCYEKLEGMGLIIFKGGYRALSKMENIIKVG